MMISSPSEGGRQRLVWSLIIAGSEIFLGLPSANKVQSIRGVGVDTGPLDTMTMKQITWFRPESRVSKEMQ